jgi:hypothetical protein
MRAQRRPADSGRFRATGFRVWLVACGNCQPRRAHGIPPETTIIEPAEEGVLSAPHAARYVETFNRAAAAQRLRVRAIAVPVAVRYEGDLRAGQKLAVPAPRGFVSPRLRKRVTE